MAYEINFFGHCHDAVHDKVWGFVTVNGSELYNFWGKRGAKFTFQRQTVATWRAAHILQQRAKEKCRPRRNGTYKEIPASDIATVWPNFHQEFEHQLILAKLTNNFAFGREEE